MAASTIGQGLDVNALVDNLMTKQQQGLVQLNKKKLIYQNQHNAYTKLNGYLSQFQGNLDNLNAILSKNIYILKSSNETVASAAISSQLAETGTYNLSVSQLAKAHQISSGVFNSKTDALQLTGELSLKLGDQLFTISLNTNDSMEAIRDHINNSGNNPGVAASILKTTSTTGEDEYRLILSSKQTGTSQNILLSGNGLNDLDLTHELQAAQNSKFTINGFQTERETNHISDVLDGITFHLNSPSGTSTISVEVDMNNEETTISTAVKALVDSYNSIIELISKNQSLKQFKDNSYSLVKLNLKQAMDKMFNNSPINSLYNLGIKLGNPEKATNEEGVEYVIGGKLTLNNDVLSKAIKNNLPEVQTFFTKNNFIKNITTTLNDLESKTLFNREKIINQQESVVNQSIIKEQSRLDRTRTNLIKKYAELDEYLSRYRKISELIDQQLSGMSSSRK